MTIADRERIYAICFYLPQFYPFPVNDKAWGQGFTDWTNVVKAQPLFPGHEQPKLPSVMGFYDLRLPLVMEDQAALAKKYKVYGFCFYYYRFGSQRVLQTPVENFLKRPVPDFPFCLCWANETWTRAWDGRSSDILLQQSYDTDTFEGLVADLGRAMADERYIRVAGRPIFLIYQIEHIPNAPSWIDRMRHAILRASCEDVSVGAVFSHGFRGEMANWVDFVVQFPPHRTLRVLPRELLESSSVRPFDAKREDYFESYEAVVKGALAGVDSIDKLYPGVCPDWDNSPRRHHKAHILMGSKPSTFAQWVKAAGDVAVRKADEGKIPAPLLFVNAWNEWAEGAMLEPTQAHGPAYLEAFRAGITSVSK